VPREAEYDGAPLPAALTVEDIGAAFVVRDHGGQQLAYVYFEDEPGRRSATKLLTKDEARRIAANIATLPKLLHKASAVLFGGCIQNNARNDIQNAHGGSDAAIA